MFRNASHLIDLHASAELEMELLEHRVSENPIHFVGIVLGVAAQGGGLNAEDLLGFL